MTTFESSKRICTSYVLKIWQMLSENIKAKRVVRCNLLLYLLKHGAAGRFRFFSNKIFTADAKVPEERPLLSHNVNMFWSKEFCSPSSSNLNLLDYFV
ncbi:hypothetical protein ALC53_14046 [Atta colombica]|uniref:Uncharacterized protein n=1 Tax=Atta colombica TaxID=520822 RepID=A0A151HXX2_9HYME|nr:hypothetical protein ALC53_14046 [Atta colombica]